MVNQMALHLMGWLISIAGVWTGGTDISDRFPAVTGWNAVWLADLQAQMRVHGAFLDDRPVPGSLMGPTAGGGHKTCPLGPIICGGPEFDATESGGVFRPDLTPETCPIESGAKRSAARKAADWSAILAWSSPKLSKIGAVCKAAGRYLVALHDLKPHSVDPVLAGISPLENDLEGCFCDDEVRNEAESRLAALDSRFRSESGSANPNRSRGACLIVEIPAREWQSRPTEFRQAGFRRIDAARVLPEAKAMDRISVQLSVLLMQELRNVNLGLKGALEGLAGFAGTVHSASNRIFGWTGEAVAGAGRGIESGMERQKSYWEYYRDCDRWGVTLASAIPVAPVRTFGPEAETVDSGSASLLAWIRWAGTRVSGLAGDWRGSDGIGGFGWEPGWVRPLLDGCW